MSALAPSVDLSQLDNGNEIITQKKRKTRPTGSAPPSKRKRAEEVPTASKRRVPFYSPYAVDHDQENMQDMVLPGLENSQRQMSPELGSPFMTDIANKGLEYMSDGSSPEESAKQKQKSSALKANDKEKITKYQKDKGIKNPTRALAEKGPYTAAEAEKLDRFRDAYCEANNMSVEKFNGYIQSTIRGNAEVKSIFDELHEVLPYRPRMSLQKFCRRRYHNFPARGTWTLEEDEMLKRAVAQKGNNWKAIGAMLDRMGEDCRDRYRNYLLNSENRNRETWTNEEVQSLCKAILECRKAIKDEKKQANIEHYDEDALASGSDSDQEDDEMKVINWQSVSDKMGGIRSRLQCRLKWTQLKVWEQKELVQNAIEAKGFEGRKSIKTKNPWRMKRASKKVANMRTGDHYALLQAILGCRAATENNIPWKTIGDDGFNSIWTSADKKAAWTNMKLHVPGSDSMGYRDIAKRLRKRILAEDRDGLNEKWNPEVHGDVSVKKPRTKRKSKGKQQGDQEEEALTKRKRRAKKAKDKTESTKSEAYVQDSSDQDEVGGSADERQGHNGEDVLMRSGAAERDMDAGVEEVTTNDDEELFENENGNGNATAGEEADSLFDEDEDRPMHDRDVSMELASRVQLLQHVQL